MMNNTTIGKASSGPAGVGGHNNAIAATIPFVIPQVLFPGTNTIVKMGQGLAAKVAYTSASTDVTIAHNLGHPVNFVWGVMAPAGSFIPSVMISSTSNSAPNKQVILHFSAVANPTVVVMF